MRRVQFAPETADDIDAAAHWYRGVGDLIEKRFLEALADTLLRIEERPQSFPIESLRTRRASMPRFPYLILFTEVADRVLVVGVFHQRRDPGAWRDRVREPAENQTVTTAMGGRSPRESFRNDFAASTQQKTSPAYTPCVDPARSKINLPTRSM